MKNKYIIYATLSLIFILIISFSQSKETKFYYTYKEKIHLNELDNKLIVRYNKSKKLFKKQVSSELGIDDEFMKWKDDSTCVIIINPLKMNNVKSKILKQVDIKTLNVMYSINSGLEMGVTDEFVVKFNKNVSQKEIDKLHKKYGVLVVKTTDIYQLLKVPNGIDALEVANKYQESGLTRFSHPNFICNVELHQSVPSDPYFVNQFSLHNTGQIFTDGHSGNIDADIDAPEAWGITKGSSDIIIAVLDAGVTSNHPDLPNSRQIRLNGSNFADGNVNNPSPTADNNHGNASTGIIGATHNNQGIAGIAPNCKIMPVRIVNTDGSGITPQGIADAIDFARQNGADIISNSWGYDSDNPNFIPVIKDAIIAATTTGRNNNKGCVVVFSAGNNFANNGPVHFPSNVNVNGVLTVGASDRYDQKSYYSPLSNPNSPNNQIIDLVAPSHRAYSNQMPNETLEAWSIDIPNNPGYNPVKNTDGGNLPVVGSLLPNSGTNYLSYTGRFGGTSYSCPQVAGVAALMLSIDPDLTQQEVFDILISSTDKVGGYNYTNGFSNELGNGRLNAFKAVQMAQPILLDDVDQVCFDINTTINLDNSQNSSVTWQVSNNVNKISSNNTSITIRSKYANSTSTGWVKATLNGNEFTETFGVNGSENEIPMNVTVNLVNNYLTITIHDGSGQTPYYLYLNNAYKLSTNSRTITFPYYYNSGRIEIRNQNSCETGWNYAFYTGFFGGSYYSNYNVFPNPVSETLTLNRKELTINEIANSNFDANKNNEKSEFELYDFNQNLISKGQINNLTNINVSNFKKGRYILLIITNGNYESHQIIIN